jgi:hypothetical protein
MRNADDAAGRVLFERICKLPDLADTTQAVDAAILKNREARGVIATIFKPPQALHQDRNYISFGNCADNPTHTYSLRGGVSIH